jgi:hypothetical protein
VRGVGHRTAELLRPSDGIRLVYRALSLRGLAAIKHLRQPEDELTSAANLLNDLHRSWRRYQAYDRQEQIACCCSNL